MRPLRRYLSVFEGTISPQRYFAIGVGLTLVKQLLDRLVAQGIYHRPWSPMSYAFTGVIGGLFSLDAGDQGFYIAMLALALPFVVVGVILTVRRLRDAGRPIWLVAFFFAPLPINIVFFIILSIIRSRSGVAYGTVGDVLDIPEFPKKAPSSVAPGRGLAAILLPLPLAGVVLFFSTHILGDYGWSLFVGLPFILPMLSVVIYGYGREVTFGQCMMLGLLWILVATIALVVTAFEGLICIIMMLPIASPVVLMGAAVGYFIVGYRPQHPRELGKVIAALLALLPTMFGAEHLTNPEPLQFLCRTEVVVDAPPERVWKHVVSFSDLAPPDDFLFRAGVAYPIRARIEGTGVGAVRHCEFSTGPFVEPIEVWDEPRLLKFSVTSNPSPMQEWNPLFNIHPPHLDGFLVSKEGQFALTPLPGGRTLLRGSTLYQHGLWPAAYWRLWSDPIIHKIHDRVLNHVKTLTENDEVK